LGDFVGKEHDEIRKNINRYPMEFQKLKIPFGYISVKKGGEGTWIS